MNNKKSFFLVIEGLDGSGKTEISRQLVDLLERSIQSNSVKLTFEPHDPSCAGLFIRQVLTKNRHYNPRTLALAFAANRADHLVRDIIPFLEADAYRIVVCDRYYLSSLVYQSTDGITMEEVFAFNAGARQPDLIIFLNASDTICYQRMRERAENKELFEANLRKTREKYFSAMEFLRKERGDNIVEVNANGNQGEVINNILNVLRKYGPDWLKIQLSLPIETDIDLLSKVITINGTPQFTLSDCANELFSSLNSSPIITEQELEEVKLEITQAIFDLPDNKVAALFLDSLQLLGYKILGEIPWSVTKVLDLEYSMPLGIMQRGIALFLNKKQSYSLITKIILDLGDWEVDPELPKVSDFIICFDFSSTQVALKYYERDLVIKKSHTSPSVILLTRTNIRDMVATIVLAKLMDEYTYCINSLPGLKQMFINSITDWGVKGYWDFAVKVASQK